MDDLKNESDDTLTPDARISELFSTLRKEPVPEADFESRFLADFHRQLAEQHPTPSFLERVRRIFSAVWQKKLVYGSSFAGICVTCVAYVAWVSGSDGAASGVNNMQANFAETTDNTTPTTQAAKHHQNKALPPLFSKKNNIFRSSLKANTPAPAPLAPQEYDAQEADETETQNN